MITEQEKRESRLGRKIWKSYGIDVFRGICDCEKVKQRMRAAIIEKKIAAEIVGITKDGAQISFASAFEATYGEPLQQEIAA